MFIFLKSCGLLKAALVIAEKVSMAEWEVFTACS